MPKKRKPYQDDLYCKDNIVAYTGDLKNNPTVYFKKDHGDGNVTYGHITQTHKYDKMNIGREEVATSDTYQLVNKKDVQGKEASYEFDENKKKGKHFHKSRGPHTKVDSQDLETLNELAKAIDNNKGIKKMCTVEYLVEQFELIGQDDLKEQLDQLQELQEEFKEIYHQLEEAYPKSIESLEKQHQLLESAIVKRYEEVNTQVVLQEIKEQQKAQEKPKLSAMSTSLNSSQKLNDSQQAKLESMQSQKDPKQSKDKQAVVKL